MDPEKERKLFYFRQLNVFVKKRQIVLAGSSLMEQFPVNEFIMGHDLSLAVYNRGVGGFLCEEMQEALEECIFQLEPAYVFLNIGTNNLNSPECDNNVLISLYEPLAKKILLRLPNTDLILMAYYPVNQDAADTLQMRDTLAVRSNERILSANKAIMEMALRLGARYIDVNKRLYDAKRRLKKEYTVEGMHLNPAGYEAIFRELLPYLQECKDKG